MSREPNFIGLGLSSIMGPKLRKYVEGQLLTDLAHYGIDNEGLKFDWSESCIEGNDADYLDGSLENFSAIYLYNTQNELVCEGWMEFFLGDESLVYWDHLDLWDSNSRKYETIKEFGIPDHISAQIPKN